MVARPHALVFGLSADPVHVGHTGLVQAACQWLQQHNKAPSRVIVLPVAQINPVAEKTTATASYPQRLMMCELAFQSLSLPCPVQVVDSEWQQLQSGSGCNTSWDSLKRLENTLLWQEDVTFLLSEDHFAGDKPAFFRWHRWDELLARANWLIAQRQGACVSDKTWQRLREALIESDASRLSCKIVQFKAQTARNSKAIAKVCNTEMGDFTPQNAMSRFDQSFLRQIKQNDGHWLDRLPWPSPAISSSQLRQWLATGTTRDIKKAEPFLPETVSAYIQSSGLYTREPLIES